MPAGPGRNWLIGAVALGAILVAWFVLAAPGCGSGDTGTTTGTVPGVQSR